MGMRYRKSIKMGPARINLSKSGVGYSIGVKGYRVTKTAKGRVRTTASIPGTGISYVSETSTIGNKNAYTPTQIKRTRNEKIAVIFFGWLGIHYFMSKKIFIAILYLFTGGLFCVGWFIDIVKVLSNKPYLFK